MILAQVDFMIFTKNVLLQIIPCSYCTYTAKKGHLTLHNVQNDWTLFIDHSVSQNIATDYVNFVSLFGDSLQQYPNQSSNKIFVAQTHEICVTHSMKFLNMKKGLY